MDRLLSSFISSFVVVRGYVCALPSSVLVAPRTAFFILFRIAAENTAQGIKGIAFGDDDIFVSWVERVQTYCSVFAIYNKAMQFCFIASGDVLTLPITPASYEWTTGKNIETINISQLGDVYLPGNRSRHSGTIECLLPSQDYPFNQPGTILDPGYYLEPLRYWAAEKIPVRYIVTESDINALVYIESVTEKEQDGTGDVYCTIALREYVDLEAQEVATLNTTRYTGNSGRKSDAAKDITYHRVVSGDTLSMLCRRTYGDGTASYYNALAKYNGISNPHLIYVGQTIKLPPKDILLGGG